MKWMLWIVTAVPVITAGAVLHFKLRESVGGKWNILPKCLATWMIFCTALAGILLKDSTSDTGWIVAALGFFLVADGLLELQFFAGMAVFALGHLLLIGWFVGQKQYTPVSFLVWIVLMALMLRLFGKELSGGKERPTLYLMLLYPAVLMAMASLAVALPFTAGVSYTWMAVGAVLFTASDMFVGKGFFHKLPKRLDHLALGMYYSGIFCLALGVWAM